MVCLKGMMYVKLSSIRLTFIIVSGFSRLLVIGVFVLLFEGNQSITNSFSLSQAIVLNILAKYETCLNL